MRPTLRTGCRIVATVGLVTSCATTEMAQIWRDPTYVPAPIRRILVIAITPRNSYRVAFEDAMAKAFMDRGFPTATAVSVFPEGRPTKNQVAAYVKDQGVDLVVMQRLARRTQVTYVAGASYEPANASSDWYGSWDTGAQMISGPAEYSENSTMAAETSVFAVKNKPDIPIWSGSSTTFDFRNAPEAAASVASSLAEALSRTGILVR